MTRKLPFLVCLLTFLASFLAAQPAPLPSEPQDAELKYVVYLSRHGVRSPTEQPARYNIYSAAPWPAWDVPPGYLTAHGFKLMEIFGAYDRMELASQGLLPATGCTNADRVTFYADSDQRTRETGKALAAGLFPGCAISVRALPEGTHDPLFHPTPAGAVRGDSSVAAAAIAGRIGGNPNNLTEAYRPQLTALDNLLATCGVAASTQKKRISLFDIPATLSTGTEDHLAQLRGPLNTASTLTENLLLEYTQGMDTANVGWGCVDGARLRSLIDLHTGASDFAHRTPAIARMQATNLLSQIRGALEQAATGKPVQGALGKPSDRVLFLVGHDTNLSNIAGLLNLTWIADGRRDDTPPGSALVFELWRTPKTASYFVRTYFTSQTLEQMRSASPLSKENLPQRVPVFIPGCGNADLACAWPSFVQTIDGAIDPRAISPGAK
jgi:4-phytase/acid phosphatase